MKKRIMSLLLTLLMVVTMFPTAAFAAPTYDTAYEMKLVGATSTRKFKDTSDAKKNGALEFKLMVKAPQLYANKNLAINLSFDNTKLALVKASTSTGGNALEISAGPTIDAGGAQSGVALGLTVDGEALTSTNFMAGVNSTRTNVLLAVTPAADLTDCNTTDCEFVVATFYMTFINGKTEADLDNKSVMLISDDDMLAHSGENFIAKITGATADVVKGYGTVVKTGGTRTFAKDTDTLAAPTIIYPNSDKTVSVPLNSIKVTLSGLPTAVPTAAQGNNTSGKATAAVGDDSAGATLPTDIKFSIVETHTGIDINADTGAITVKPAATAGTYTVKAASASKSKEATAQFTLTKAAAVAGDYTVTANPSNLQIRKGATGTLTVSAIKDQFGADFTATPSFSVKTDNAGGKITVSGSGATGTISVAADATVGNTAVIAVTVGGVEKTYTVKVADLTANTVTGVKMSKTTGLKVGDEFTASVVGTDNNKSAITWSAVSGCTLKSGNTFTVTTAGLTADIRVKGVQAATASVQGFDFTSAAGVRAEKKDGPAAPTGLTGVEPSVKDGADGKINGTTAAMEFKPVTGGAWADCSATATTVSAPGKYLVRVKETADTKAGETAEVDVPNKGVSKTPDVTVTADCADPTQVVEGSKVTLTANVTSDKTALVYQWTKDGTDITGATGATYVINQMAAGDNGVYNVKVKNTESGKEQSAEGTAAAGVTLTMKTIPVLTLTAKTGPVTGVSATGWKLSDLVTATPADADIDALFGSDLAAKGVVVTFYEVVKAPASTDPAATGETTSIVPVTTLESGKTYYADIAVTASDSAVEGYKLAATAGKGAPADEAALAGYLKVETASASSGGSYVPSQFTVRYVVGENGTMTGNATETVKRGESPANVPAVTAKEGFYFRGWSQNGKDIVDPTTVTVNSNVTFTALFAATKNTYISGYPDRTFRPDASVTRAEIASMLARLSKDYQANGGYTGSASDVAADAWFANAVNFGLSKGFITGYEDGTFQPDGNITRGEFASMMARYMGLTAAGSKQFTDTQGYWASSAISALADAGIVSGYEDGSFHPGAPLTRAEAVQMINVALKVVAESAEYEIVPTDVSGGHWAYHQILTAMNTDIKDIVK